VVVALATILRLCFGTLWIGKALRQHKAWREVQKRYDAAYQRREDTQYHRDWAKQRGDHDEARVLEDNLRAVDAELDRLEDEL
ncbi:unnamed protein product, partial [Phaeothamnion confervicola]